MVDDRCLCLFGGKKGEKPIIFDQVGNCGSHVSKFVTEKPSAVTPLSTPLLMEKFVRLLRNGAD